MEYVVLDMFYLFVLSKFYFVFLIYLYQLAFIGAKLGTTTVTGTQPSTLGNFLQVLI